MTADGAQEYGFAITAEVKSISLNSGGEAGNSLTI